MLILIIVLITPARIYDRLRLVISRVTFNELWANYLSKIFHITRCNNISVIYLILMKDKLIVFILSIFSSLIFSSLGLIKPINWSPDCDKILKLSRHSPSYFYLQLFEILNIFQHKNVVETLIIFIFYLYYEYNTKLFNMCLNHLLLKLHRKFILFISDKWQ